MKSKSKKKAPKPQTTATKIKELTNERDAIRTQLKRLTQDILYGLGDNAILEHLLDSATIYLEMHKCEVDDDKRYKIKDRMTRRSSNVLVKELTEQVKLLNKVKAHQTKIEKL
jgi:hypothetical protein